MIRERQIATATYAAGTTQTVDLPRDAVYHTLELSVRGGTFSKSAVDSGTASTLDNNFPFSIIKNLRLIRNGSDVVWQGSGAQLAKEHLYLNKSHPFARIYSTASNVETLRTATSRGITVPANTYGIGECTVQFVTATADSAIVTTQFDFLMELWLQMGPEDLYYGTLVDARKLASYQLELQYAAVADISIAGNTTDTIAANIQINSYDQDNLDIKEQYGTFKRSADSRTNLAYGSSNQQVLLPRGNYFHGIIFQTRAAKANSTTVLQSENACITQINNRINSNYTLRAVTFKDLQSKNLGDVNFSNAYQGASGSPEGWAWLYYPVAGRRAAELVPTYDMDQFDIQLSLAALASSEHGATTSATLPTLDFLYQEVIPGVSVGDRAPKGAQYGSSRSTSAKPYA